MSERNQNIWRGTVTGLLLCAVLVELFTFAAVKDSRSAHYTRDTLLDSGALVQVSEGQYRLEDVDYLRDALADAQTAAAAHMVRDAERDALWDALNKDNQNLMSDLEAANADVVELLQQRNARAAPELPSVPPEPQPAPAEEKSWWQIWK